MQQQLLQQQGLGATLIGIEVGVQTVLYLPT